MHLSNFFCGLALTVTLATAQGPVPKFTNEISAAANGQLCNMFISSEKCPGDVTTPEKTALSILKGHCLKVDQTDSQGIVSIALGPGCHDAGATVIVLNTAPYCGDYDRYKNPGDPDCSKSSGGCMGKDGDGKNTTIRLDDWPIGRCFDQWSEPFSFKEAWSVIFL